MAAEIITFLPQAHLSAGENLAGFIDVAQNRLKTFGEDLPFHENRWNISRHVHIKSKTNSETALTFSNWETAGRRSESSVYMPEPYLTFAKAYFRYQWGHNKTKDYGKRLAALRAVGAALEEQGNVNPIHIGADILNRAAARLPERLGKGSWYGVGIELERLVEFLNKCRLVVIPISWKSQFKRQIDNHVGKVGKEFNERRAEKMPSPHALEALANIHRNSSDPADQVITSLCAILLATPDRGGELMNIRTDCESVRTYRGKEYYGLRWWPAKGGDPTIKEVIPVAQDMVKEALARLRHHSEKGRALAQWYSNNPQKLYLEPELEHLRSRDMLSMDEVALIIFDNDSLKHTLRGVRAQGKQWCKDQKVPVLKDILPDKAVYARFADVELAVVGGERIAEDKVEKIKGLLPRGFPMADEGQNLLYADMLAVFPVNFFSPKKATYRCMFEPLGLNQFNNRLSHRKGTDGHESIFDKHGYVEPDGSQMKITSHQFRHYLNTLAEMGGMSELDLAKWSGRASVQQNAAYKHMSSNEYNDLGEETVGALGPSFGEDSLVTTGGGTVTSNREFNVKLYARKEYLRIGLRVGHSTMFGWCAHDFAMTPCQIHEDCMNCNEQFCIKGDAAKEANLRSLKEETEFLLAEAKSAEKEGHYGATNWVRHQEKTLERINQLLSVIDNPAVMPGAVIYPVGVQQASRIAQARAIAGRDSELGGLPEIGEEEAQALLTSEPKADDEKLNNFFLAMDDE